MGDVTTEHIFETFFIHAKIMMSEGVLFWERKEKKL